MSSRNFTHNEAPRNPFVRAWLAWENAVGTSVTFVIDMFRAVAGRFQEVDDNASKNLTSGASDSHSKPRTRTFLLFSTIFLLITAPIAYLAFTQAPTTEAGWFDDSYAYRKQITFTNSSNAIYSARKVLVEVDTATLISNGKMQSSCQDARFTNRNGKVLRYFIDSDEGACNTASTDFYVEVPRVHSAPNVLYFYYGNPAASSGASNEFFAPSGDLSAIGDSLKGYWKLDEASGTREDAAHNNSLTDANTVPANTIRNSTVADFERDNSEYLSIADNAVLSVSDEDFTVGGWIKMETKNSGASNTIIAGKILVSGDQYDYVLQHTSSSDQFSFQVSSDGTTGSTAAVSSAASVSTDTWYYVIGWHDSNADTINIQVNNGTTASTSHSAGVNDGTAPFELGRTNTANYHDGLMANVGFWKRTLSAEERAALYNSGRGTNYSDLTAGEIPALVGITQDLKAYWNLDETSGTRSDSHGSNDLTDNNTVTSVSGKLAGAGDFEADNSEYLSRADNTDLSTGDIDFSVSTWVKLESESATQTILSKADGSSSREYWLTYENAQDKFRWLVSNDGSSVTTVFADSFGTISSGTWYLVTAYHDAGSDEIGISINNGTVDTTSHSTGVNDGSSSLRLGAVNGDIAQPFDGLIDNTMFWKRTLTADERTALYNSGNGVDFGTLTYSPDSGPTLAGEEQAPEPAAYWSFNEAQGQTAQDGTSNNNDGTLGSTSGSDNNDPTWTEESRCVTGPCLEFDGSDDYVDMGNDSSLQTTGNMTINAWIRASDTSSAMEIVGKDDGTNRNYFLHTLSSSPAGGVRFGGFISNTAKFVDSTSVVVDNRWHLVTGVNDGTDLHIYIDGILNNTASGSGGSFDNDTVDLEIGRRGDGTQYFNGFIDEVKIYPYARSADQIKQDFTSRGSVHGAAATLGASNSEALSEGLVGYWKMDDSGIDAEGESITDSSGNGNSGTLNGDDGSGDNGSGMDCTASGQYGTGCDFDGTDDWVEVPDSSTLEPSSVTACTWFKIDDLDDNNPYLIHEGDATNGNGSASSGYFLTLTNNDDIRFFVYTGTDTVRTATADTSITAGTWHHACGTYSDPDTKVYLDGELIATESSGGTLDYSGDVDKTYIGRATVSVSSAVFDGTIDETRIYNRALSPAEVRQLYNFAPGPVAHWKMDDPSTGSGQAKVDSSGNGNNGTTAGSNIDCTGQGKFGKACDFNGSDDYVDFGDVNSLDFDASDSFTTSFWFKTGEESPSSDAVMFSKYKGGGSTQTWYTALTSSDNFPVFKIYDGTNNPAATGSTALNDNQWHYFSGVRNVANDTLYLYIDGVLVDSTNDTTTGTLANSHNVHIGCLLDSGESACNANSQFDGQIDDVRIYNYALTQKQIINAMNSRSVNDPAVGSPVGHAVGEWNFDEGYGTTANDTGTGVNNGTLTSMASPATSSSGWQDVTDCKVGKCLAFDGSDDYVSTGDVQDLNDTFTFSAWVKPSDLSATSSGVAPILARDGGTGTNAIPVFRIARSDTSSNRVLQLRQYGVETQSADTEIAENSWAHVAVSVNEKVATFYLNGVEDGEGTFSGSFGDVGNMDIARYYNWDGGGAASYFPGLIDQVRIYNYALTEDEVKLEYNLGASQVLGHETGATETGLSADDAGNPPVATWQMEEGSGSSINDTSGNGNTGTITGATWSKPCYGGSNCLSFDGSDDYVEMSDTSSLDITNSITLSTWIKPDDWESTTASSFFSHRTGTLDGYFLFYFNSTNSINVDFGGNSERWDTGYDPVLGEWQLITYTYDSVADEAKFYVDGKLYNSSSNGVSGNSASSVLRIGADTTAGQYYFDGQIDHVKIWDRALSQKEIAYEYNRGRPIAHWKFDECSGTTVHSTNTKYDVSLNGTITAGGSGTNTSAGSCSSGNGDEMWDNGTTGKYGGSLDFDGTDDYVSVGNISTFKNLSQGTFSAWVKTNSPNDAINPHGIYNLSEGSDTNNLFLIEQSNGNGGDTLRILTRDAGNVLDARIDNVFTDSNWHHIVYITNSSGNTVYVDGKTVTPSYTVGTSSTQAFLDKPNSPIYHRIGLEYWNSADQRPFNGQIDDVRIYNYALSADEVRKVYNQGSSIRFGD